MEDFCTHKNLQYEPVNDWDKIDAKLYNENGKQVGLARLKSCPSKYGSQPVVAVEKELLDFLHELGLLCGYHIALMIKFRDKVKYFRLDKPSKFPFENKLLRGKSHTTYLIPIVEFKDT
jgi:hypothetical protein